MKMLLNYFLVSFITLSFAVEAKNATGSNEQIGFQYCHISLEAVKSYDLLYLESRIIVGGFVSGCESVKYAGYCKEIWAPKLYKYLKSHGYPKFNFYTDSASISTICTAGDVFSCIASKYNTWALIEIKSISFKKREEVYYSYDSRENPSSSLSLYGFMYYEKNKSPFDQH